MTSKKSERQYLKMFLNQMGLSPVKIVEREKPDFELHFSERIVGLEITEFFSESGDGSHQHRIGIWKMIMTRLNSKKNTHKESINICFNTNGFSWDSKTDTSQIVELIEFQLSEMRNKKLEHASFKNLPITDIYRIQTGHKESFFNYIEVNSVIPLPLNELDKYIKVKESKFLNYDKFEENWLLIGVNFFDPASDVSIPDEIKINFSGFSNIFVHKYVESELTQIRTLK